MRHLVKHTVTFAIVSTLACGSGGGGGDAGPPPCDGSCQDGVAILALRDTIKLVYNFKLSGQPDGPQNQMMDCLLGGKALVSGTATSNGAQGTTTVDLTYVFKECAYSVTDTDPTHTFQLTLDGTVTETGTIAVQPSSTTALIFKSPPMDQDAGPANQTGAMSFSGTVYAPPMPYLQKGCALQLGQDGNEISGKICGRDAGTTL
jgi:hypothetical protein